MAIAFSAITGMVQNRAPANPLAVGGNILYARQIQVVVPASTTVATLDLGYYVDPGTLVVGAVIDTDTSLGTSTLSLKTETAGVVFVAAKTVTVVGGEQCTIAANKGVISPSSATAKDQLQLILAAATSPASVVTLDITLYLADVGPVESPYGTKGT